jgi:peptidyl-prolyl cis-trans isomerase A (cyclophilin A)
MALPHLLRRAAIPAGVALAGLIGCARGYPSWLPGGDFAAWPLKPDSSLLSAAGPDSFTVRFHTSKGDFDVRVHRDWAPRGADRIYYLARSHFYDEVRFFRVVNTSAGTPFVAQWGLNGDTAVSRAWRGQRLQDDATRKSNVRGTLSFAAGGPNTRTTQIYVNYGDNSRLDTTRFAVFGQVVRGMDAVVDSLNKTPTVPSQDSISRFGNAWLVQRFPKLDYIRTARVIEEWRR